MDRIQLSQSCRAITKRQLVSITKSPRVPVTYLIDLGRMKD